MRAFYPISQPDDGGIYVQVTGDGADGMNWFPHRAMADEFIAAINKTEVNKVIDAYTIKGPNPELHDKEVASLHKRWPALANALEALIKSNRGL